MSENATKKPSKTEMKRHAQDNLMDGIANVLGYWEEGAHNWPDGWEQWTEEQKQEYRDIMRQQADRIAKLLGFEQAWSN